MAGGEHENWAADPTGALVVTEPEMYGSSPVLADGSGDQRGKRSRPWTEALAVGVTAVGERWWITAAGWYRLREWRWLPVHVHRQGVDAEEPQRALRLGESEDPQRREPVWLSAAVDPATGTALVAAGSRWDGRIENRLLSYRIDAGDAPVEPVTALALPGMVLSPKLSADATTWTVRMSLDEREWMLAGRCSAAGALHECLRVPIETTRVSDGCAPLAHPPGVAVIRADGMLAAYGPCAIAPPDGGRGVVVATAAGLLRRYGPP